MLLLTEFLKVMIFLILILQKVMLERFEEDESCKEIEPKDLKDVSGIKRAKSFRTKKSLGQNFLIDENVINKIIEEANLSKDEKVIEIGAGIGFVTEQLAENAKEVIAIEVDSDAINELSKLHCSANSQSSTQDVDIQSGSAADNIKIVNQDILKTDISTLVDVPVKMIANIPYYMTIPILVHLLGEVDNFEHKNRSSIKEIILMVQYEVAKRIVANENRRIKNEDLFLFCAITGQKLKLFKKSRQKAFGQCLKLILHCLNLKLEKNLLCILKIQSYSENW